LSWAELKAFLAWAPEGSAVRRLDDPLAEYKAPQNQLLMNTIDTLAWANWQRARRKTAPKPRPVIDQLKEAVERQRRAKNGPKNAAELQNTRAELARRRKLQRQNKP